MPTRGRPNSLRRCLEALGQQTLTLGSELEIVVVDDGSADSGFVPACAASLQSAELVRLGGLGPAAARNAGVRAASGDYICFTDDDCAPAPQWAEWLVARLAGGADAVAGTTFNGQPADKLAEASQTIANYLMAPTRATSRDPAFAPSNNLACRADVLAQVPFDEGYPDAAAEDREWCTELLSRGLSLEFEPRASVLHFQELDLVRFLRQHMRYGRGAYQYRRHRPGKLKLEEPGFYARLLAQAFERGFTTGALVCVAQGATAAGFAGEWLAAKSAAQHEPFSLRAR